MKIRIINNHDTLKENGFESSSKDIDRRTEKLLREMI